MILKIIKNIDYFILLKRLNIIIICLKTIYFSIYMVIEKKLNLLKNLEIIEFLKTADDGFNKLNDITF